MRCKKRLLSILTIVFVNSFILICSEASGDNNDILNKSIISTFGGTDHEALRSVCNTCDGGFVVAGYTLSTDMGFEHKGGYDSFIIKYNKYGEQEWMKNFGGSNMDCVYDIIETSDKGIIVVGESSSTDLDLIPLSSRDAIMIKYNKEGELLWVKNFGGAGIDCFNAIAEGRNGELIIVGYSTSSDLDFINKGGYDSIILKYTKDGELEWVKNFGGSSVDYFNDVIVTSSNEYIVAGESSSKNAPFENKGGCDGVITKYNKNGELIWVNSFGGSLNDFFNSVVETLDDKLIVVGQMSSSDSGLINNGSADVVIIQYNQDGQQEWIKSFGGTGNEDCDKILQDKDGGFIIVGYTNSTDERFINKGSYDMVLVKYDKDGTHQWTRFLGGAGMEYIKDADINNNGDLIIVGYTKSNFGTDTANDKYDALIIRYNKQYDEIFNSIIKTENDKSLSHISFSRELVNNLSEGIFKKYFQDRINNISVDEILKRKTATSNLDLYIKCENILMLSLDTNSITFDDFSGVEDMEKTNAVNLTINSSLPYQLNAYLPVEIQNADKSNTMDKRILNIKENSETTYQTFTSTTDKIVLKDNCSSGNDLVHGIDIKLKGGIAHEKDVYKTTIKFEAEQK